MITWVVGRGGLLGKAIERACSSAGERIFVARAMPWSEPEAYQALIRAEAVRFQRETGDGKWRVVWAAGAATTATEDRVTQAELTPLRALVTALSAALPSGQGCFFLTSSAGGVYAGSTAPPFTADTPVSPVSAYGQLKVEQEQVAATLTSHCPVVIGRVSNLYGPGQNLGKLQGLVSRLVLAALTQQAINIFVPLDTIRDYIYVDDAARQILSLTSASMPPSTKGEVDVSPVPRVAVVGSGRPATVGQLLQVTRLVTKRRVPVAFGAHRSAAVQAADLRVVPTLASERITPLPTGVKSVFMDLQHRLQSQVP